MEFQVVLSYQVLVDQKRKIKAWKKIEESSTGVLDL